ncbi:hypothetical protein Tco_0130878, partial [Tanacetum coccineum]
VKEDNMRKIVRMQEMKRDESLNNERDCKAWFGIEDCSSHDFHKEGFDGLQKQHLMRKKWFEKEMRNKDFEWLRKS